LRDADVLDIGSGVSIIDFQTRNGNKLERADRAWKHNILFCRKRTDDLFNVVMHALKTGDIDDDGEKIGGGKVIVTGAPGIGKSAMLYRVMREAFKEKNKVVLDRRQDKEVLVFLPKDDDTYECWKFYISGGVGGTLDVLRDPEAFLLVDPSGGKDGGEPPINIAAATLITASPNPTHHKQFGKNPFCKKMYMANWNPDELLAIRKYMDPMDISEEDVGRRFAEVGGIVRHVYSDMFDDILETQERKVNGLSMEKLADVTFAKADLDDEGGVSHFVFTYKVTKPFGAPPLQFTSPRVYDLVKKRREDVEGISLNARLEKRCLYGTLGYDFENYGINSIFKGGSFPTRLVHGKPEKSVDTTQLNLSNDSELKPECTKEEIHSILGRAFSTRKQQRPTFARCPKNFPVADMVTSSGQLLDMTVNASHCINCPGLAELMEVSGIRPRSRRKLDLFFGLPPGERYNTFKPTWKNPKGLEWVKEKVCVYALSLPLVEPPILYREWQVPGPSSSGSQKRRRVTKR
jgi:hypothetical protein